MLKKSRISFFLFSTLVFILSIFLYLDSNKSLRVAHAGGQYNNKTYPNSIASINFNSKHTKFFELDLQLTKDKRLVCLHDAMTKSHDQLIKNRYYHEIEEVQNKYFHEIKDEIIKNNFCYDEILKNFLNDNDQILIITDFKTDNIEGLRFIKKYFDSEIDRFIPQIYYEDEYKKVKNLGFEKIIFTLYRIPNVSNDQISKMIKKMDLFALTMNPARLRSGIAKKIDKQNFFIYVHTVNSILRLLQYKLFFGADEIYTDNLF